MMAEDKKWWEWLEEAEIKVVINVDTAIRIGEFKLAKVEPQMEIELHYSEYTLEKLLEKLEIYEAGIEWNEKQYKLKTLIFRFEKEEP